MGTPSRATILAQLRKLASGLAKYPPPEPSVVSGQEYDNAEIAKRIQVSIDAEVEVQKMTAKLRGVVAACNKTRAEEASFLAVVGKLAVARHKGNPTALLAHGLSAPKPNPKRTTEEKLLMQAKMQATRKERRTLGKKQKKAIKGNVTAVTVTPVVEGDDE